MRWLWRRRRGRRRGGDGLVQRKSVVWDASWGETFLPAPDPATATASSPATPAAATVVLGFVDGTQIQVSNSEHVRTFQAIAKVLTGSGRGTAL
jgi:hypothetical protein